MALRMFAIFCISIEDKRANPLRKMVFLKIFIILIPNYKELRVLGSIGGLALKISISFVIFDFLIIYRKETSSNVGKNALCRKVVNFHINAMDLGTYKSVDAASCTSKITNLKRISAIFAI